jgi:hypothetical protein
MSNNGFLKRLENLAQSIKVRRRRWITVLVDGNSEDQSAADAIVQELEVTPDDIVIYLARFSGADPDLPRLGGITDL